MSIYLPIAEMNVNILLIISIGMIVGCLSGLFGVGGGFLMTPLLIFLGIPPVVAVGTEAPHVLASSVSGVIAHWRRKNVDFKMGLFLLIGGVLGSTLGVNLFKILNAFGQIDIVIQMLFLIFLGFIGFSMAFESAKTTISKYRTTSSIRTKLHQHSWIHGLPFKMRFHRSKLYISAIPPILIGFLVGILSALMGVGGGFIMIPAMVYILGMSTNVVVGTSLFFFRLQKSRPFLFIMEPAIAPTGIGPVTASSRPKAKSPRDGEPPFSRNFSAPGTKSPVIGFVATNSVNLFG